MKSILDPINLVLSYNISISIDPRFYGFIWYIVSKKMVYTIRIIGLTSI